MAETKEAKSRTMIDDLFDLHTELDSIDFIKGETAQVGTRNYKYQDLPSLAAQIKPVLRKYNFVWYTQPSTKDGEPSLRYTLLHRTGEKIEGEMLLMSKSATPQDQGSAITYARRYSETATLDIVTDEDDDGKKVQDAAKAPISEANKRNILLSIEKLGQTEERYEQHLGKPIDALTNVEAQKAMDELKTLLVRASNKA